MSEEIRYAYPSSGYAKCFDVFDSIEATTKRTEKAKLLMSLQKSKAAWLLFLLAMNKDNFYVTEKTVDTKHNAKTVFEDTNAAMYEFFDLLWKLKTHKISGNAAKLEVNIFFAALRNKKSSVHASTHKWCLRVLDKNLRMGVDSSVHEVWPGIVEIFGVAKGKPLFKQKTGSEDKAARKMIRYPCDVEPKKDGFNISFRCDLERETAVALSSDNMELPALKPYAKAVLVALQREKLPKQFLGKTKIIIDGECEARYNIDNVDDKKWDSAWGKVSALCKAGLKKKTGFEVASLTPTIKQMLRNDLCFSLYEIYPVSAHVEKFECPRPVRRALFEAIAESIKSITYRYGKEDPVIIKRKDAIQAIDYVVCRNQKELEIQHRKNVEDGEEGSIVRMPDVGVLADSAHRGNYVKVKEYSKWDAVILGVNEGTKRNIGSAGTFVCWLTEKKALTKVTVPSDVLKKYVWGVRDVIHGFYIECVEAKDKTGEANATRNPVMARFRDDQQPMSFEKVIALCKKNKLPVPSKDNMGTKLFSQALAKIAK